MHPCWLLLLTLLAACRAPDPPGTVVLASGADLQSVNPLRTTHALAKQVQRYALLMTLVRPDSTLAPRPYLAEEWTWSEDELDLTFRLRTDVRWHDGTPTTAEDVAFTLDAARGRGATYPRAAELACVDSVRVVDSATVQLSFCQPQDTLSDVFGDLAILPAHRFRGDRDTDMAAFETAPVGNGPFRFVAHEPNRRWVFESDPGFPPALGGPAGIRRLVIAVVDEPTTKLAGLVAGELDVAGISPMHAAVVRRMAGRAVVDYPLLLSYGLAWNTAHAPFDDVRVRRALTMAIDRRQLVDIYLYGFGEMAAGPVPSAHPLAARVNGIPFDRDGARVLLDSLGWRPGPDGIRVREGHRLAFVLTTVGSADNVLEQLVQADLAAIGVAVTIRQLELGSFLALAQSAARDYDALVMGITGDPALGYLGALFDSRRRAGPLQYAQYADATMDRALDAGELDLVQAIAAHDVPITFLYHARGVQGVRTRIRGMRMDLRGELATLASWHVEAPR